MAEQKETLVLVADSRRLVRELLSATLARVPGVSVTVASSDFGDMIAQASVRQYSVALLGGQAYPRGLAHAVERVKASSHGAAVLVVVEDEDDDSLLEAVEAGATGFVTLHGSFVDLTRRVLSATSEETVLPPKVAATVLARARKRASAGIRSGNGNGNASGNGNGGLSLTSREREVLVLLTDGLGNAEIADHVGVSANTVKNHLYSIYRKLGVNSRAQAFAEAARLGLVTR